MTDTPPSPAKPSPMAVFKDRTAVRHHMIYKYEQDKEGTKQKSRQLRELQAFVEWEDYTTTTIAPVIWDVLSSFQSDSIKTLSAGIARWDTLSEAERFDVLKATLSHLSSLFQIAPPALATYDKWLESLDEDNEHVYNPQMYAIYNSSNRLIVLNRPNLLTSAPVWICIGLMAHEFAHHLIRVKAEELFENLQQNIDHREFRKNYPHDRSLIADHPLCAVISICEEFRHCEDYREIYEEKYLRNTDTPSSDEFIEEALALSFEGHYSLLLREALLLAEKGYTTPSALAYADILLTGLPKAHGQLMVLSAEYGTVYESEKIGHLDTRLVNAESCRAQMELMEGMLTDISNHTYALESADQILEYKCTDLKEYITFLEFCTGRFSAYDGAEQDQEA